MDFSLNPAQRALLTEFRIWLERNVPNSSARAAWENSDPELRWQSLRRWHARLFRGGWVGISWPRQHGGRRAGLLEEFLITEELAMRGMPFGVNEVPIAMIGPLILRHGARAQKSRYLKRMLSGDDIWCQGFSEPGAGSDLAAISTQAKLVGDIFLVNGRKIWTSFAHRSDFCLILARTDAVPKRKEFGLSLIIVDLKTEGLSVRPLTQITGDPEFCEITFDSVRVPKENLVGPLHGGWFLTTEAASRERLSVWVIAQVLRRLRELTALMRLMQSGSALTSGNRSIRQKFAQLVIETKALRCMALEQLSATTLIRPPGPKASAVRILAKDLEGRIVALAYEIISRHEVRRGGLEGSIADTDWLYRLFLSRGGAIARGTVEIHRNLIARLILKMPQ